MPVIEVWNILYEILICLWMVYGTEMITNWFSFLMGGGGIEKKKEITET